jgi:hypothetical protein
MGRCLPVLLIFPLILAAQQRRPVERTVSVNLDALARAASRRPQSKVMPRPSRATARHAAPASTAVGGRSATVSPGGSAAVTGFGALLDQYGANPPDTGGAVGPNEVVTMLNSQVLVQSRGGQPLANFPIDLAQFWSGLGGFAQIFDPRILYDPSAGRWLASAGANPGASSSALLLAVSRTSDPAGDWSMSLIDVGSGGFWADYPLLGFNQNWVVITANLLVLPPNGSYAETALYAFDRAALYAGSTAYATFFDEQGALIPVLDVDNSHPEELFFAQATSDGAGGQIRLGVLQGAVGSETFSPGAMEIALAESWADTSPGGEDFAPQPGTYFKVDAGDSRLQNCVMRNGSLWCAHTVFLPYANPTRASVQWFQADPVQGTLLQLGRIDDPQALEFYAYPSIAVNRLNDVALGYTRFTTSAYPAAAFSFRLAGDAAGVMRTSQVVKAGEASYVAPGSDEGSNRWGDFSCTMVDPLGDLAFWTVQEYAALPTDHYPGRWGTWWANIVVTAR